jgi:DNA-directed RNA polymerase subunit RPC12/RpoP
MALHDPADRQPDPADSYAAQARVGKCIDCLELVDHRELQADRRCASCHQRVFTRVVVQPTHSTRPWWKRIRS